MPFDATSSTPVTPTTRNSHPYRSAATPSPAESTADHHEENLRLARESVAARVAAWAQVVSAIGTAAGDTALLARDGWAMSVVLSVGASADAGPPDAPWPRAVLAYALAEADRRADDAGLRGVVATLGEPQHLDASPGLLTALVYHEARLRRALHELVRRNIRLVHGEANKTAAGMEHASVRDEFRAAHLSRDDLAQEASIGLLRAARMFDPERGLKLSTYACWWIKHAVGRAVTDKSDLVRVPNHIREKAMKALRKARAGEPVAAEEARAVAVLPRVGSGNRPTGHTVDAEVFDIVADANVLDPGDAIDSARASESLAYALHTCLTGQQRVIVRRRFLTEREPGDRPAGGRSASDGAPGDTLLEIGADMGISRERVRQIQQAAVGALRGAMDLVDGVPTLRRLPTRRGALAFSRRAGGAEVRQ